MAQPRRRTTDVGIGKASSSSSKEPQRISVPEVGSPSIPSVSPNGKRKITRDIALSFTPAEPTTGVKRKRPALQVDEVPPSVKRITLRDFTVTTPRVVRSVNISKAPLDSRDAFVLQLIDGTMSMSDLADASGMSETDVEGIVARLVRLGIVTI